MNNSILQPIRDRRSSVCFSGKSIDEELISRLFEAARWAPSANNAQPWRFIYATNQDEDAYKIMFSLLFDGNKVWAENAPLLILSVASSISDYTKKENIYAWHDTGMATENLLLQAFSVGLQAHPMGGFDRIEAKKKLNIPDDCEPITMIAVGYKGDIHSLPNDLKKRETSVRSRKDLNTIFYKGNGSM